ncbi:MAG: ferritin-like domain-containing protein [Cyanobacteria bacterium P01_H01_bin.119]
MTIAYPRKFQGSLSARDIMGQVIHNREIHMVTLNRYRFNEQRSCVDLTNVIEQLDGTPKDLIKDLSHHVADEARHAVWLTDLLVDLGAEVGTPPGASYIDEFERLIDDDQFAHEDQREDAIIDMLAAVNVTEKRGCEVFSAHVYALKRAPQTSENVKIRETIEKILPEEAGHVRWGTRRLAEISKQSPAHREKVERARCKYIAIEQAAYEAGDITFGAEVRRIEKLVNIANMLPVWQRPQYLMERLPMTLIAPEVQRTRFSAAQRAWEKDPQLFVEKFIPMFFNGVNQVKDSKKKGVTLA